MMRVIALVLIVLSGCNESTPPSHGKPHGRPVEVSSTHRGHGPISVVCTTGMVADLILAVGGDRVQVTTLMGEGVDPHLYKPSPGDVAKLDAASLILFNGLHLEGKMAELFSRLARRRPTFAVAEHLAPADVLEIEGAIDPHVWFDVSLWRKTACVVRDVLVAYDPAEAKGYQERYDGYAARLDALHEWARKELSSIPPQRRVLVTAHDAFRYFGRAYGIEVRGIQGISTESEAGVSEVNALVDFLTERKIKAVFVESSVSERNVKAIQEGCTARGHRLAIGGELFSDAMGKSGTPEGSYEGMVRHNVRTIVEALK
ncbi:MAG: manganese transporter [Planctomycetia bacterium]|nr:manganese transporter [Planctomycetia bacterium]